MATRNRLATGRVAHGANDSVRAKFVAKQKISCEPSALHKPAQPHRSDTLLSSSTTVEFYSASWDKLVLGVSGPSVPANPPPGPARPLLAEKPRVTRGTRAGGSSVDILSAFLPRRGWPMADARLDAVQNAAAAALLREGGIGEREDTSLRSLMHPVLSPCVRSSIHPFIPSFIHSFIHEFGQCSHMILANNAEEQCSPTSRTRVGV